MDLNLVTLCQYEAAFSSSVMNMEAKKKWTICVDEICCS
jgi:hypothetical protein